MEESEILGLHNAYHEKYEQEFKGSSKTFVAESEVLKKYIQDLCEHSVGGGPLTSHKQAFETKNRVIFILEQYQEQTGLIDPHLEEWITPLMGQIRHIVNSEGDPHFLMELIYTLCKIRGHKTIVKFFPHEASDLEPAFDYLCKLQNNALWQSHYVLLIWLSIIVLVPFDLDTIDSEGGLIAKVIEQGKLFLEHTGRPREAASLLLAKLLTRPDIEKQGLLTSYIDWAVSVSRGNQEFTKLGALLSLVHILSQGQRGDLLQFVAKISDCLNSESSSNMFLSQLKVKLAGRLALVQLKPVVASWRYHRGSRSLLTDLSASDSSTPIISNASQRSAVRRQLATTEEDVNMEYDIDFDSLESQIDCLLQGLRDRDNVVRWSAAKAVGRVTNRLEREMGDDIVEQVLQLFQPTESDSAWHGGCLALAELARRGLLLPERLRQVFPLIYQALLYDKKQGHHSIGAHVRDAACYVAWSFARAYAPEDIGEHLHELARYLIIVALFDREINCRRAASAAFQEHVGRQGSFPHGIEILTEIDYFTLGNRNHAYLQVSCFVAQFPEYLEHMIRHLIDVKLKHWDAVIRQLAACALSVLVPFTPEFFLDQVIPVLIPLTVDNNLVIRDGSILGIGEIMLGLAGKSAYNNDPKTIEKMIYKHAVNYYLINAQDELSESEQAILKDSENRSRFRLYYSEIQQVNHFSKIPSELLTKIKEIVPNIEKRRLYRGKGGQIIRQAVCRFLQCIAKARVSVSPTLILKYQETINDCIVHTAPEIRESAAGALLEVSKTYHNSPGAALLTKTLKYYLTSLDTFNQGKEIPANIPRGLSLALGCLNSALIKVNPGEVVNTLVLTTKIKGTEMDDAETRMNSAQALGQLMIGVLDTQYTPNPGDIVFKDEEAIGEFNIEFLSNIFATLFMCMDDYSLDKRGDVGSWVRTAAMESLERISNLEVNIDTETWNTIIGLIIKQVVEKMDRMRQIAGDIITRLLNKHRLPEWTEELRPVFVNNKAYVDEFLKKQEILQGAESLPDQSEMPVQSSAGQYQRSNLWSVPAFVFPIVTPLMRLEVIRPYLITGIVVSVGGITESTVRSSSESLVRTISSEIDIAWDVLRIFKVCPDRLHIPFMKTWSLLLRDVRDLHMMPSLGPELLATCQLVIKESRDIHKWLAAIEVFGGLLDCPECHREALKVMLSSLGQAFPKVRQQAASLLYNYFLGLQHHSQICESEETFNKIVEMIASTSWILTIKEVRPVRNEIFGMLGMEAPKPIVREKQEKEVKTEIDSYQNLVNETGR